MLISYLLDHERKSLATPIVEAAFANRYRLLVSDELLHELVSRVQRKPYVQSHIKTTDPNGLVEAFSVAAEHVDFSGTAIPKMVRDSDDDYLIALAVAGNADLIITGDHDVLAIADLTPFRILSRRAFADLLHRSG